LQIGEAKCGDSSVITKRTFMMRSAMRMESSRSCPSPCCFSLLVWNGKLPLSRVFYRSRGVQSLIGE
jgi:hypothetical protein